MMRYSMIDVLEIVEVLDRMRGCDVEKIDIEVKIETRRGMHALLQELTCTEIRTIEGK